MVSLAPLRSSPKPPRRHTPLFCRRIRISKTKRSIAAAASISETPLDINSDRNTPSSFLIRFEKSTDSPGIFTMKAPRLGTTKRLCVSRYFDISSTIISTNINPRKVSKFFPNVKIVCRRAAYKISAAAGILCPPPYRQKNRGAELSAPHLRHIAPPRAGAPT